MKETDDFAKMLSKVTILNAETVELDVEVVEQVAEVNVQFSHNVCVTQNACFVD